MVVFDDGARLREVEESGAVLVGPDQHIAWRSAALPDALAAVLGRGASR